MVLRKSSDTPEQSHAGLLTKLDAIGYGFFIPIFFISSGMGLDLTSIVENPGRLLLFFLLLLAVRGLPALLVYRRELELAERLQLVFLTATALPLIVALTEIGLNNGTMLPENAAALVGAGVLSVAVYPLVALQIRMRAKAPVPAPGSSDVVH
jgi:Kef-type K+ transport system membrane component KefB